jgi:hypothetical protein
VSHGKIGIVSKKIGTSSLKNEIEVQQAYSNLHFVERLNIVSPTMKNSTHLLLRTPILPGESLPSYLVRLAKLNDYHTPNMVAQICQERLSQPDVITRPTRAETYARLAELVNLDDERLCEASAHTFAITILPASAEPELITLRSGTAVVLLPSAVLRQHLWPKTDAQFCPRCLAEASYYRLTWLPRAVPVCLAHRCLLVKGCPI